eukprot:8747299-Pyramimonas_sp.AAC.2
MRTAILVAHATVNCFALARVPPSGPARGRELVEVTHPHFYGRGVPREPQLPIGATRPTTPARINWKIISTYEPKILLYLLDGEAGAGGLLALEEAAHDDRFKRHGRPRQHRPPREASQVVRRLPTKRGLLR